LSTATSITTFSTKSGDALTQENFTLLAKLQGSPIHAPSGPHLICAGARPITKTQLQANQKAAKEAKAKAAEEKTCYPCSLGRNSCEKAGKAGDADFLCQR
jgi:hypothetical protein